ncbi:hypothetical protein CCM_08822 [Cordyceps militaris CM01]|uniref:Uncharacterized protein n=1 Tax=Cordyceps militaris (strain CM01) TaxID=983644 RepID=G3JSI4_CORMM|nr:uncharacterized protein CCM_08822 [Cordyceps militaris CM01]EGX88776.1 hypothetical protein CCM_08822 [Cordyceps militaris CM01]
MSEMRLCGQYRDREAPWVPPEVVDATERSTKYSLSLKELESWGDKVEERKRCEWDARWLTCCSDIAMPPPVNDDERRDFETFAPRYGLGVARQRLLLQLRQGILGILSQSPTKGDAIARTRLTRRAGEQRGRSGTRMSGRIEELQGRPFHRCYSSIPSGAAKLGAVLCEGARFVPGGCSCEARTRPVQHGNQLEAIGCPANRQQQLSRIRATVIPIAAAEKAHTNSAARSANGGRRQSVSAGSSSDSGADQATRTFATDGGFTD